VRAERENARAWRRVSAAWAVVMAGAWLATWLLRGTVRPGDLVGMAFGVLASLWLLLAALYGVRRRLMGLVTRLGLGRARAWLWLHLYGGGLFLLAVLLHTGLRWPVGLFSWTLWLLSLWTVATGVLGLAVQRTVPRLLASGSGLEVSYERIPELVTEIRHRAEALAEEAAAPVRGLYTRQLAPVLAMPRRNLSVFLDAGGWHRHLEPLGRLRALLPGEERRQVEELEGLVRAKLDLDAHYTLQQVLRTWLWLHVPASALLVVLVVLHIAAVIYY
jgi:hypothetical protein